MKNAELIARLRVIAGKGMADYFNSGHPNSNAITEAADAIEKLQAEVKRLGMALHGYQVAIETAEESLKDRVALAMEVERLSAAGVSHCGHRPPRVECSKYAAKQAQPVPEVNAMLVEALEKCKVALEWAIEQGGGPVCEHEGAVCFCKENTALNFANAALTAAKQQPSVPEGWKQAVALAYGHLWHVNNEPMAPIPLRSSETAAYEARKQLRDLLTHEERGLAINQVQAILAAAP